VYPIHNGSCHKQQMINNDKLSHGKPQLQLWIDSLNENDSGQISTKINDKRDDFNFKIINFPNMCSNIPASPAYGVPNVKNTFTSHIDKKNIYDIFVETLFLYIFTIWKSIVYNLFCRDEYIPTRSWYRNHHLIKNNDIAEKLQN
jgi:hypothetical protein